VIWWVQLRWQKAGQRAAQRSANVEAISHLTKGLELLKPLPDTPERAQQELTLQIPLGVQLQATKGFASPEVERVYARARDLCQQVGKTAQLFPVLWGLWFSYLARAELQIARETGEQLLTLAQSVQDAALLLEAHMALGATLFHLGEFALAREYLEQGIVLYNFQQHRSHAFVYGTDPGVNCRIWITLPLWFLGYPDQALRRSYEAITLARETAHSFSLGFALDSAAWIHRLRHGYVLPEYQRQGVGSMLMQHLERQIEGVNRIVVGTYAGNYKARGILEAAGYQLSEDEDQALLPIQARQQGRRAPNARLRDEELHVGRNRPRVRGFRVWSVVEVPAVPCEGELPRLSAATFHIQEVGDGDAVEPGAQAAASVERRESCEELYQDLLWLAERVLGRAPHRQRHP
jgi:GNAT superfamily N-acetyltransferase